MPSNFGESVLVHVGLHKCGSTWLQNHVFSQPEHGFYAPLGAMAAAAVTEFVEGDPVLFDASAVRSRLEMASAPRPANEGLITVVSHEALSSRPHHGRYYAPKVAGWLKEVFGDVKLLLIFREQTKLIYSLYGEHVRNGGTEPLSTFIGTGNEPPGFLPKCRIPFFHFDRLIEMYKDMFGDENVLAMPLEFLAEDADGFTDRIFSFCGAEERRIPPGSPANTGDKDLSTEFMRLTRPLVTKDPLSPRRTVSERMQRKTVRVLNKVVPKSMNDQRKAKSLELIRGRIGNQLDESNRRLADMTGFDLGRYKYSGVDA